MFKNLKIRSKMLMLILGINGIMFLVLFIVYYGFMKNLVVSQTQQKAVEKVEGVKYNLEAYLSEKAKIAWTFCRNSDIRNWLAKNRTRRVTRAMDRQYASIIDQLKLYVKDDGELKSAFIASEKTQWYYESAERPITDDTYRVGKRQWYKNAVEKGELCYDIDVDAVDLSIAANIRVPIYDSDENLLGVGGVDLSLERFTAVMNKLGNVFKTGEAYLIGSDGTYYYHPSRDFVLKKHITDFKNDGKLYDGIEEVSGHILSQESGIAEVVFNGDKRYFMYTPVESLGWSLVLSVSAAEINSPLMVLARTSFIIILVTILFLVIAVLFMTDMVAKPIKQLVAMIRDIAEGEGDLTLRLNVESNDEVGELARWFNIFVEKVHLIISKVKDNAHEVDSATRDINDTSTELASGIEEQTSQLSEVAVSIQEMTSGVVQNSRSTDEVADQAEEASRVARQGLESIQKTREEMGKISETANTSAEIINKLSQRVDEIGQIVWVISDIAAQTKVLALNASIEVATTENEGGEGFTVVVEEVRNLVKQTTEATEQIRDTISSIQADTASALSSMGDVQSVVDNGLDISQQTEEIFEEISKIVGASMQGIKQIATVSKEQSGGAETISHSIASVSAVAKQSARGIEMLSKSADKLKKQTEELNAMVDQFRLKENF